VCNVPTYGTAAVAQFTFALILALCHRAEHHSSSVHAGDWTHCPDFCYWLTPQTELAGKTLGILGFGRIGRAVGRIAKAFGMEVITTSRSQTSEGSEIACYVTLDELLQRSDVLSLHCPLFPETDKLINAQTIAKMCHGAFLINTSRGGLVDEEALAQALKTGKLRGAAVDVVSREPMEKTNPLLSAPNCIITPHIAWAPTESRIRLMETLVANIQAFLEGNPINVVN
jgi:glycerate dehydrogenase